MLLFKILLYALGFISAVCLPSRNNTQKITAIENSTIEVEGRIVGGVVTPVTTHKYITAVYDTVASSVLAYGGIINAIWMVTASSSLESYDTDANKKKLVLRIGYDNINTPTTGILRKVHQFVFHPDRVGEKNNIGLIRFCPSVPSDYFASLPQSGTLFPTGTMVTYFGHDFVSKNFIGATKPVGEVCECENIPNWTPAQHICLKEDPNVYSFWTVDPIGYPMEVDGKFIGILEWYQEDSGEMGIRILSFMSWITANTPTAPFL